MTASTSLFLAGRETDPTSVLGQESYRSLSVDGRLKALTALAGDPERQETALGVYLADETLPDVEYWLYESDSSVRSPLVARLYATGREFVRAVVTPNGVQMARQKLARDQSRLEQMKEDKNDSYISSGDTWHDNPGWKDLEQAVQRLERDIRAVEKTLLDALVCDVVPDLAAEWVTLGSTVTYRQTPTRSGGNGIELEGRIVGMYEQDPDEDEYSYQTPVAHALRGLRVGEAREFKLPAGWFKFQVISLSAS
jgi:transcription elongation GreA/GreB family factor